MEPSRELHWQSAWAAASLSAARRLPGRDKFYAIVAYPGSSGFLHVGHLRGLSLADTLHRYHRMLGHSVFFPTGTHASGLPAVTFAQKVANRDPAMIAQLRLYGVPEATWPTLEDPAAAARYLGQSYLAVFRRLGLLIDERAYVTTIDPDYQAFIGWQFRRLSERGALRQGPHFAAVCPVCGPVSVDPSETDLSKGGDAEKITYRTVPFRLEDGRILLAATLRPETIYGVTNLWVPPAGALVVWHHGDRLFLVTRRAAEQLVGQHGGRIGHDVPVEDVIGRSVQLPIGGRSVPVVASRLVDPEIGTGVVMSVPAHAPADWLALATLPPELRAQIGAPAELLVTPSSEALAPSERELLAGPGTPAERAARATGARSLEDREGVAQATERLYRLEFVRGRMRPEYVGGRPVAEAREIVAAELARDHHALDLQEFSEPVICRNGHVVEIRRVPDQWFLHYGDPAWKERTRALVGRMRFDPPEYSAELRGILDWYDDRPCTRRGRWLGTPFPFDPTWVIEPIADSTFYPAYFVVRPFVRAGRLTVPQLTDAFFDHVFLGQGGGEPSVDPKLQQEIRDEFLYWYPLDVNIGGKEHKRVHFPLFLYTHALLLPEELQPRRVTVHWWLTSGGGEKISKRHVGGKGGAIPPLQEATDRWGADALRLFYATAANLAQDIEWDPGLVDTAAERLREVERIAGELRGPGSGAPPELESWLSSEVHDLVAAVHRDLTDGDLRAAAGSVFVTLPARLRRYVLRGGERGELVDRVVGAWVRLMSPFTPHLAEELGAGRWPSLVAEQPFPTPEEFPRSGPALDAERYLERVEEDLRSVHRLSKERGEAPRSIAFFVAAPWKAEVEQWIREAGSAGSRHEPPIKAVMERTRQHANLAAVRSEIAAYVPRVAAQAIGEPASALSAETELKLLRSAEGYFVRRFGVAEVIVVPESEGAPHDPKSRRDRARPGRPAFYLVNSPSTGA
jgi:leucyl-tRNA synthetase